MKLVYTAVFQPCEEGGYCVTVPALPGCITEGDDLAEAVFMVQDAASLWVLTELEDGHTVPADLPVPELESGAFSSLIALDIDAYAEKYGRKAVRKNVTIPAWLNTYGERDNLNFSQILTDALQQRYLS